MILRLKLKNWRSIAETTVILEPLTIVVGRNSSGKSNLVDAIRFVDEMTLDAPTAIASRGGITGVRRWSKSKPYDVSIALRSAPSAATLEDDFIEHEMVLGSSKSGGWSFKRERISVRHGEHSLAYTREHGTAILASDGQVLTVPTTGIAVPEDTSLALFARQTPVPWLKGRRPVPLRVVRSLRPAPDEMRKPQTPSMSELVSNDASNIATVMSRMSEPMHRRVVAAMAKIIPGLVDISTLEIGRHLTLVFTQSHAAEVEQDFQATEMSDGALRALAVVVAALQVRKDDVLIVEEPEVNLHPGATAVLYEVLARASTRGTVVLTTHSPELLDLAQEAHVLVCDYEDGLTKVGPLSSAQRAVVREGLFTVAELMRTDELRREGAKPKFVAR